MTRSIDAKTDDRIEGSLRGITIDQLSIGEQLVVWAFRNRLAGGSEKVLAHGFHVAFGLSAVEAALAAFHGLFDTVFHHCKRDLGFHDTRCRCVSGDEIVIVSLIAANHADMIHHAREIGRYLVIEDSVQELLDYASTFSLLMQRHNLRLPLRPLVTCNERRSSRLH